MKELFTIKFAGRMRRAEYWSKLILLSLLLIVLPSLEWLALGENIVLFIITYILTCPYLALVTMGMTVRRLHDGGFSGWMMLWSIIPTIICALLCALFIASKLTDLTFIAPMPMDDFTSAVGRTSIACLLFNLLFAAPLLQDSEPGENKYGLNPKGDDRGRTSVVIALVKGVFTVRFAGRMQRRKFWLSQLLLWPLNCLLGYGSILGTITASLFGRGELLGAPLILLWILCAYFSLVTLGMQVRRLHDIGISGWKYLLGMLIYFLAFMIIYFLASILAVWSGFTLESITMLVLGSAIPPVLVSVILIVLFCRDSQYGANQWGPNPKGQGNSQNVNRFRLAAEQGDAMAQYSLGWCYANGYDVNRDYAEAMKWYRRAADNGDHDAMFELGKCYLNGTGIAKDKEQAKQWFKKAADEGNTDAKELLQKLEQK